MLENGFKKRFNRVIQLELNELSQANIDLLIQRGLCPNFKKIQTHWQMLETQSETEYQYLEPWIQWITVHTGKTFSEHQVFHLSDADQLQHPQIWEVLSEAGLSSAIIGSMNARQGRAKEGIFFPDPWSKSANAHPEKFSVLYRLVQSKVHSHASAEHPLSFSELYLAAKICLQMRLPISLIFRIGIQIIRQQYRPKKKWQLAALFDEFLFAIFRHVLRTTNFSFYTLFLNSIAHYQHHYWRHFQPEQFDSSIVYPDCEPNDDPITFGYQMYDRLLGEVFELSADPATLVIVATGLSQVPYTQDEEQGGMNYYRLRDHQAFLRALDLPGKAIPLMSRDWQIVFEKSHLSEKKRTFACLSRLTISGEPLFQVNDNAEDSLFLETAVTQAMPSNATIFSPDLPHLLSFYNYFNKVAIKSGHHDTRGLLYLSNPHAAFESQTRIPLANLFHLPQQALLGVSV